MIKFAAVISHLTAGRSQIGTSLSFHLFFAVLGVGLPLMMLVAEGMHLRTGDPVWRALARRWSKVFAVLFAVGAASGTIISFELGLLFPRFMAYAGGIIGLPFSLEGAAFFIEAIFVGIYLYGWNRLSPRAHWLSGIPIAVSAVASAFFIVTANAWMNVPRGFPLPGHRGTVLNVKVPHLLSLLAFDDPKAPVRGLDSFPKADRTPLAVPVRLAFIGMVGIGTGLVALGLWYWLRRRRGRPGPEDRPTMIAVAVAGPAAFMANELGWLVSELGRQPWTVYGVFRTSSGITSAPGLGATFTAFTLLYVGLTALTVWAVRRIANRPVPVSGAARG